jgi:hypothetical protein
MGFVWASFLSPSWLETRLYLSIALPSIQIEPDNSQLLHTMTLGSLLGDLLGADQHWAGEFLTMHRIYNVRKVDHLRNLTMLVTLKII